MPRVKRGVNAIKKRRTILKLAKGYREVRHKHIKAAREAVIHSMTYSHRDRIVNKRNFRKLWIIRINSIHSILTHKDGFADGCQRQYCLCILSR